MSGRPTRRGALRIVVASGALLTVRRISFASVSEPEGYRLDSYQGETPATLNGAPALTTAGAHDLWTGKSAVFIDVLPHAPRPQGLPADTIWRETPHRSVAGAHWLPEVGRGTLAAETERYFQAGLAEVTDRNRAFPLVIFCKRNCWMSWNAAKRAESYGYTKVRWYAEGIDGWSEAGLPVEVVRPKS